MIERDKDTTYLSNVVSISSIGEYPTDMFLLTRLEPDFKVYDDW